MTGLARFEEAVLPHLDAAYNLARWLTRNDHDAEDVVQEAFMRAMRYFDRMKGNEARPWLLADRAEHLLFVAREEPARGPGGAGRRRPLAADGETVWQASGAETNPEVILLQSANRKLVNQALEELPVAFREVIVMREIEDLSYKEIASIAGIPAGTVMSRLSRGRELLRQAIESRMRRAS
jgi:RNA polymerase sigma factor, sigma-70 family